MAWPARGRAGPWLGLDDPQRHPIWFENLEDLVTLSAVEQDQARRRVCSPEGQPTSDLGEPRHPEFVQIIDHCIHRLVDEGVYLVVGCILAKQEPGSLKRLGMIVDARGILTKVRARGHSASNHGYRNHTSDSDPEPTLQFEGASFADVCQGSGHRQRKVLELASQLSKIGQQIEVL
ncbi:MAG TPA: hypothetical protein VNS19_22175 [Acidimicrobiales bacterium]|nr:hypothetical protein [Acidimicrobiales bacterium]